jgi:hypothetical protein
MGSLPNKAKTVRGQHLEDTLQKKTRIQRETVDLVLQKCDRSCQLTKQVQQKLKINSSLSKQNSKHSRKTAKSERKLFLMWVEENVLRHLEISFGQHTEICITIYSSCRSKELGKE